MANRLIDINNEASEEQQEDALVVNNVINKNNNPVDFIKVTVNLAVLQNCNGHVLPNPYAEIHILNNLSLKYVTNVKSHTNHPNWCECFNIPLTVLGSQLIISVWNFMGHTIRNLLGECYVNLQDLSNIVKEDCDTINITRDLRLNQFNGVPLRSGQISFEIKGLNGLKISNIINNNSNNSNNNNNNNNNNDINDDNANDNDNTNDNDNSSSNSSNTPNRIISEHCCCQHNRGGVSANNAEDDDEEGEYDSTSFSSDGYIEDGILQLPPPTLEYFSFTNIITGRSYRWSIIDIREDRLMTPTKEPPQTVSEKALVDSMILNLLVWLSDSEETGIFRQSCPQGWMKSKDSTQCILYFELINKKVKIYCSSNGKQLIVSVFMHQCDKTKIVVFGIPSAIHFISAANLYSLPINWKSYRILPSNIEFFCNHHNRVTQWNVPGRIDTPVFKIPDSANMMTEQQRECIEKNANFTYRLNQFKYLCFTNQIDGARFTLVVDRADIFKSSYDCLMDIPGYKLRNDIAIEFLGECGVDSGGITREWYLYLTRECLNPDYGLFEYTQDYRLQINPNSYLMYNNYLHYFRFIGRILAMALYHNELIYTSFCHVFYKTLLGAKQLTMDDLKLHDSQFYNSLLWISECDLDGGGDDHDGASEFWFAIDERVFDQVITHDLVPNGQNIRVTNANKEEYARLMMYWKLTQSIEAQMKSIKMGFNDVIPIEWLIGFDEFQLDVMLCGIQEIDVNDWKQCTSYLDINPDASLIKWFWDYIESCDNIKRGKILQFITGTHRPPFGKFSNLVNKKSDNPFTIRFSDGFPSELPIACTCANRIDIPEYESYDQLVQKFNFAIEETVGFGNI